MFLYLALILVFFNKIESSPQNWYQLVDSFNKYESKHIESDIEIVESISNSSKISSNCRRSVSQTLNALKNSELFAYQMYDSWPTFPPQGILEGTVSSFGDYDQCLSIGPNAVIGSPQYCLITVKVPLPAPKSHHINVNHRVDDILPEYLTDNRSSHFFTKLAENAIFFHIMPLKLGLCLPNKCDANDVKNMAQKVFETSGLVLMRTDCNTITETRLNRMQMLALSILIIFLITSIFATFFSKSYVKNPKCQQFLQSFSLKTNAMQLMSTNSKPELSCIDGLRVLTMVYIIVAHIIEYTDWTLYKDTFRIKASMNEWQNIPLSKVHTLVETFFLFSGLLASYTTLQHTRGNSLHFNPFSYVISRIIRLLPLMVIFILMSTLVPLTNSGPFWNQFFEQRVGNCYTNWWKNFLFVHNLIDNKKMCIGSTWFISADFQFHLLSLFVIMALLKKPTFGLILNSLLIVSGCVITAILVVVYDFSPGRVSTQFGEYFMVDFLSVLYWKPWLHAPVYFTGMAFGYLLYKRKAIDLAKNKRRVVWSLIASGYLFCLYDTYYWTFGAPNNRWISALLLPFTRILWSVSTSAIVWMCVTGNGGVVDRLLSWSAFIPLSRLTYTVYLTHIWISWSYWASRRQTPELYPSSVWVLVSYAVFYSYLFGFGFALLFESPIVCFQSYLRSKLLTTKVVSNNNHKRIEISLNPQKR